jgi:hypothetical protein
VNKAKPKEKPFLVRLLSNKGVDFVILFLAITLGFFADNFREEFVGNRTAHEMATEMMHDISSDTIVIYEMLDHAREKGVMLDSLYTNLDDSGYVTSDSMLYVFSSYVGRRRVFERHTSTYTLLISTGYMKYFCHTTGMAMAEYEVEGQKLIDLLLQENALLNAKVYPLQQEMFHTENFNAILKKLPLVHDLTIRNWNADNRFVYKNYISEMRLLNQLIIDQYVVLLKSGRDTHLELKAEYGEDEE